LGQAMRRKHVLPVSMIFSEFAGGIVGLFGEYSRSLKRVTAIRKKFV
jgi:hypothetical protein